MKKGTLTSGKSDKKVTSKKQAIAIGLSEAREKGAKVPAKKTAAKKAAPKKAAAKKKAAPKKAAAKKKAASKKAAPKKAASRKKAPSKSPAPKTAKKPAGKAIGNQAASKKKPSASKAKMPGETSDTGEFISTPVSGNNNEPVTNADINNVVTPEAESDEAVFAATTPDQQYIPEDFKASAQDPYHGNINPSKAKTSMKPAGKKPLWDNRK